MGSVLIAADDSDASQLMIQWILDTDALLPDAKVHLLHVTIRDCGSTTSTCLPGADYFEQAHPHEAQKVVMDMLHRRFLCDFEQLGIQPVVHIIQASQDSKTVGRIICNKAEELNCHHVYLAAHDQHSGKFARFLKGPSVSEYVQQHCKVPLTIVAHAGDEAAVSVFKHGEGAAPLPS